MPRITVKLDSATHAKLATTAKAERRTPGQQLARTALAHAKSIVRKTQPSK